MPWYEEKNGCIEIMLRVVPRASKDSIQGKMEDGCLKVRIQAPPVDGKANQYLVKYLSKAWEIPRSHIEIVSGETGRNKRIRLLMPTEALKTTLNHIV